MIEKGNFVYVKQDRWKDIMYVWHSKNPTTKFLGIVTDVRVGMSTYALYWVKIIHPYCPEKKPCTYESFNVTKVNIDKLTPEEIDAIRIEML